MKNTPRAGFRLYLKSLSYLVKAAYFLGFDEHEILRALTPLKPFTLYLAGGQR